MSFAFDNWGAPLRAGSVFVHLQSFAVFIASGQENIANPIKLSRYDCMDDQGQWGPQCVSNNVRTAALLVQASQTSGPVLAAR